jgi:hypothetical protein
MAASMSERSPLLVSRVSFAEKYVSVRRGRPKSNRPEHDVAAHHAYVSSQLDEIWRTVARRERADRDPGTEREIIAIRPTEGARLEADSFGDRRLGMRVVAVDDQTGTVFVDASRPDLPHIRSKIDAYADDTLISPKTGARRSERAVANIGEMRIASLEDLIGGRLREAYGAGRIKERATYWFEVGCRGGQRERTLVTDRSRRQIERTLEWLKRPPAVEFLAPEQIVFFVRITFEDLRALVARVDCVYEVDLAPPPIRDWLLFTQPTYPIPNLAEFRLLPPDPDAVSVALLDTGVTSNHPLLAGALLAAYTVVPNDSSIDDADGHGTQLAGVALHDDVGALVEANGGRALHWLETVKLLKRSEHGTAAAENARIWPVLTLQAIQAAESGGERNRVFALTVTAPLDDPAASTTWSQAVDQFAFNENRGRLICVSIGNSDAFEEPDLARLYPRLHLDRKLEQPAQAANALTIGAFTARATLPPEAGALKPLAPVGGISPNTRAGTEGSAIKPDVVFEGGNVGFDGDRGFHGEATLTTLTTGRDVFGKPLVVFEGTSAATGHAARFVANVWAARPESRPETIRGLVVHSARWTDEMVRQFKNLDERLALCGYGVPDISRATECLRSRATLVVEDRMPNSVLADGPHGEPVRQRVVKYIRLPIPDNLLLDDPTQQAELAVTLSYFAEPSTFRRREQLGLRLRWDIQGTSESEVAFQQRINKHVRDEATEAGTYEKTRGFEGWAVGPERRGRGTVQSDRLSVPASYLAGAKLIAVSPVLGWWDRRIDTEEEEMVFSLIVSLEAPGLDIYTPISLALATVVEIDLDGSA